MKKIFVLLATRNESDIIESYCRYNSSFCDGIIIYERGSSDNTNEIIRKLIADGLPIYLYDDPDITIAPFINGECITNAIARRAIEEYGADMVIPLDTDEFLYHVDGINPRETLESLREDIVYQILWRTYIYEKEPDITLGFMPNNFFYCRKSSLESVQGHAGTTIVSKFLLKEKNVQYTNGAHWMLYPEGYKNSAVIEILSHIVCAHFPIRSKTQVKKQTISNWIYKWGTPSRLSRNLLDLHQVGMIFNSYKEMGELTDNDMKHQSLVYSLYNNRDRNEVSNIVQTLGDPLTFYDPMNVSFCTENTTLRYTDYSEDNRAFIRAVTREIDFVVTFLASESDNRARMISDLAQQNEALAQQNEALAQKTTDIINSTSWEITRPLRVAMRICRRICRITRRSIRLCRPKNIIVGIKFIRDYGLRAFVRAIRHKVGISSKTDRNNQFHEGVNKCALNILYVIRRFEGESKRYRVFNMIEALSPYGISGKVVYTDELPSQSLEKWSMVVFFRVGISEFTNDLLEKCKKVSIPTVFDIDDLVFDKEIIGQIHAFHQRNEKDRQSFIDDVKTLRAMLDACDYATASTAFLCEYIQKSTGKKAYHIPNSLNYSQINTALKLTMNQSTEIKIGFLSGTLTHNKDFEGATEALVSILKKYPQVSLVIVGYLDLPPCLEAYKKQISFFPFMDYLSLLRFSSHLYVVIIPLEYDTEFCHSKSELKYFEQALVGVPVIASPTETYKACIKDGVNGLLAADTLQWESALERIIVDRDFREKLAHNARLQIREVYYPDKIGAAAKVAYAKILRDVNLSLLYPPSSPSLDSPFYFEIFTPTLPLKRKSGGRDILFVSHDLSHTGAPIVLMEAVRIAKKNGDLPVVVSLADGPLKQEYLDMGVTLIVDESLQMPDRSGIFEYFACSFDLVFVNTLACGRVISALNNSLPPVLWWIHETSIGFELLKTILPKNISKKVKAYAVSDYCAKSLSCAGLSFSFSRLGYGVHDRALRITDAERKDKILFLIIGGLCARKGQDILLKAIGSLESRHLEVSRFVFIGKSDEENVVQELMNVVTKCDNIDYFENNFTSDEIWNWYRESDCLIIPSREDSLPAVATEAMMFSKPVICSNQTGTADFITHNENGIVFDCDNHEELAQHIVFAIENKETMEEMGRKARKEIYEKHFTFEEFTKNVLSAIDEVIQSVKE